ncbi:MAG: methyl-accepting chemotaxis protein [Alphaproteobacteria bacterium]
MTFTIAHRLILGFGLTLIIMLSVGWYQMGSLRTMKDVSTTTVNLDFDALQLIRETGNLQREMRSEHERAWIAYLLASQNKGQMDTAVPQQEWQLLRQRTTTRIHDLRTLATDQAKTSDSRQRRELWAKVAKNAQDSRAILEDIGSVVVANFDMINRGDISGVDGQFATLKELRNKFSAVDARTEELAGELAGSAASDIQDLYIEVRNTTLTVLAAALFIGILLAVLIYRSITLPIGGFMEFVRMVGSGDLTQRAKNTGNDEIGRLGVTLNEMVASLAEVSSQTKVATENLNSATAELQASAQQQAASTSEQSAAVQQITSTLDEITQSGSQISERAKGISQSAEAASVASKSGMQAVAESSRAMLSVREQAETVAQTVVALTEKTQSVGEIIASVNEIAERSNLLALNAAIEAASAGEQGASFSIVADEMKNLADQAKEATGQVHGLLNEIQQGINSAVMQTEEAVKRADFGAEKSKQTEGTISELAQSVEQSVATFEQIIAATNQQQIGIEQVSSSVQNIREASEQIAAGINDLEKSASGLNAMSSQLRQSVERFQL